MKKIQLLPDGFQMKVSLNFCPSTSRSKRIGTKFWAVGLAIVICIHKVNLAIIRRRKPKHLRENGKEQKKNKMQETHILNLTAPL